MAARDIPMENIHVGEEATFRRSFTEEDVDTFASLSGDYNPLHVDETYASTTIFKQRLVHGMLLGSLCSRLVGMYLPGKRCLYLSQDLVFKKPVFLHDMVEVTGTVIAKSVVTKILTLKISITRTSEEMVVGNARVQVL